MKTRAQQFMLDESQLNGLYRYAMTLCLQSADAYDLLQSSMEKYLVQARRQPDEIKQPEAYLRTLMYNRFVDQYRQRRRWQHESFEECGSYDISPVDLQQVCIETQQLDRVWALLTPLDRNILYHWAVLGYSTDEVCEQLEMPRGTLLARIHRLRKRLQQCDDITGSEGVAS